ncbi:APOPTOSIS INHIBITOR 5-LIKE ISOFORM X1 [Salix purpurea]|uniref:APOPTOSIS INHIBITOR 5-LIKE ISOFORM X1 n=1 Tax=Salix purpurea TaxID=77065 RepID=A0A9Q0U8S6_SALPP|nr:APOPTOSIS INHIBITOR 5-LIKE ISOFORM X1 [Salix purpurea]
MAVQQQYSEGVVGTSGVGRFQQQEWPSIPLCVSGGFVLLMGEEGRHLNHMHDLESFEKQTNLGRDTCSLLQPVRGYKIVTGQPSDRLGEDFSEFYTDLIERLSNVEDLTRATMRKLTQGMTEHNKAMAAAKSDDAKDSIKTQKKNTTTGLRTCNNILAMAKPLHAKTPLFIGDKSINLSWKEVAKPSVPSTTVSAGFSLKSSS